MKRLAACATALMVSCSPIPDAPTRTETLVQSMPKMHAFTASVPVPATRANAEIAQDFIDLSFQMESGRTLPTLTRFEGPITVRVTGPAPATLTQDLEGLLTRLRNEAGLPINATTDNAASITIEAVPQETLQRAAPRAACFVVPRVSSWQEYLQVRRTAQVDWTTLTTRQTASIFLPADAAPQEIRDCLHEELAQALGPLNDLYRLPDSVFNDDNIHTVLTGFDMLILRTYYAQELRNGMSQSEVAMRLPGLLARMNPAGELRIGDLAADTSRDWIKAMETALTSSVDVTRRRNAAEHAIHLGRTMGWNGPREGFALYAYGRLQVGHDPKRALDAFNAAEAAYLTDPTTHIHAAHIAVQKAAFAMASGDARQTLVLVENAIPVANAHQNAALLSTLMMFKAEALEMMGNADAGAAVRLDSLGWARYGFGSDQNVAARLSEIAALRPF